MPIQGSGAISISDLVSEFAGQAPHSLTEYYRNGSLVDSTRNVAGTATKSDSGTTSDFAGITGISVTRTTGTVSATSMTLTGSQVTVPAGAYVDFTVRRRGGRSASAQLGISNFGNQGPDDPPFYSTGLLTYQTTLKVTGGGSWAQIKSIHSVSNGNPATIHDHDIIYYASNQTGSGLPLTRYNPGAVWINGSNRYRIWPGQESSSFYSMPRSTTAQTKNGHALQQNSSGYTNGYRRYVNVDVSLRIKGFNNTGSAQTFEYTGSSVGQQQNLVGNAGQAQNILSLSANSGGSQTVYTYAVTNGTGSTITATVGGVDTTIAAGATTNVSTNNDSSSLTIAIASTVTLNSGVPTSGAISLTDFYGAEEQ